MNKKKLINWINLLVTITIFIAIFIYLFKIEISVIEQRNITTLLNKIMVR